jgi:ribosomal protein S18 acetylase RimI-like enzyme
MADVRLEPMTDGQYRDYRATAEDRYAKQIAESGLMAWPDAVQKASEDFTRSLPDGLATPDNYLWTAYDGDAEVGMLWLWIETRSDGRRAFIGYVSVREEVRRRGYGEAIMTAAEARSRELGAATVALNVFGHNVAARALYEGLGYEITSVQMRKRL